MKESIVLASTRFQKGKVIEEITLYQTNHKAYVIKFVTTSSLIFDSTDSEICTTAYKQVLELKEENGWKVIS